MDSTLITILSTMENIFLYDRVVVLDEGKVVEQGDPNYLLRNKESKLYQRLLQCDISVINKIKNRVKSFQEYV